MTSNHLEKNWHAYMEAYNTTDEQKRKDLLESCVSDDVKFTNPGGEGKGRAAMIAHIQNFQKNMPGAHFNTDKVYVHHGELLAVWSMHKKDGTKVATGYNFVQIDGDNRFSYMGGFF